MVINPVVPMEVIKVDGAGQMWLLHAGNNPSARRCPGQQQQQGRRDDGVSRVLHIEAKKQ